MSDILGYAASGAVMTTFLLKRMPPLRAVAILSNILFAAYGYSQHIYPVLLLHVALLPVNMVRLLELCPCLHHLPALILRKLMAWIPFLLGFATAILVGSSVMHASACFKPETQTTLSPRTAIKLGMTS